MADIIRLLPDHVANQIAAGEVVQRPASVVKELLENAIDAGSTEIKLIVKNGGKTLIQVVDNGTGMSETDVRLSFERHATSKIQKAEDLFNLSTKGFRGEALASIAAIAHVETMTKMAGQEVGVHLKIEGSKVVMQEVAVVPKGTSMLVKNLFFNIPARRNFLKSDQVEFRHITDEFHRVALAHPNIAFQFHNNGGELYNLPPADFKKRIVHIFGRKTADKLVPITEDTQVLKLGGYVVKPEFAKKSRGEQFFFANHRFIKSPYLHHAVLGAFDGLLRQGVHPGYFINLEVDPASIDINIHPTKTEVKFDDEHTLYAILKSAVKHSLGQFNIAPVLDFDADRNLDTPYDQQNKAAPFPRVEVDRAFNPFQEKAAPGNRPGAYQKAPTTGWEELYGGAGAKRSLPSVDQVSFETEVVNSSIFDGNAEAPQEQGTTFQLKKKYVVTTIKSGMVIINQSRAHQRVLYERFLGNMTLQGAVSQQLLFPLCLSFTPSEIKILIEIRESLTAVGFIFDDIQKETVEIKGVPVLVSESEVQMVMEQLIADFQMEIPGNSFSQGDMLAKTLAKALSVKTGETLDEASQTNLVNDLFACKEPALSPFNKAIYVTLTENDIERKFI
ncbi:DNA mismatch repair endonuclease MutL [Maribacter sp. 2307ULW6-5]|uniref:DNA mismatch repair endonuclease MutL n=1 Tax=Maribacter sp. 2307ULW6-5 TaxID=3386275 RepID=UPI0039BD7578